jgi:hypothetical protein
MEIQLSQQEMGIRKRASTVIFPSEKHVFFKFRREVLGATGAAVWTVYAKIEALAVTPIPATVCFANKVAMRRKIFIYSNPFPSLNFTELGKL